MAEKKKRRKLSFLQEGYRDYFLKRLKEYKVKSPAELSEDKKREFFGGIPKEWLDEKKDLKSKKIDDIIKTGGSYPVLDKTYKDTKDKIFIVSSINDFGEVELVEEKNAFNIVTCSIHEFKESYKPVKVKAQDVDSPLSIALIEASELVATLNAMMRTVLVAAPESVRESAKNALRASKDFLQSLAQEVRED